MNFGPSFRYWVHTFYHNISSCIVNNGHASEFIPLKRGVRRGCPLSGMLFILAVEPLAIHIRTSKSIKGLKNGNKETKVSLYADDTTTFIHDDLSVVALFALLDRFSTLSGLRINKSKTEGLWLGSWKNRLGRDEPFGISWPKQYVSSLGVAFAYEVHVGEKINFDERLVKMKKVLNLWSGQRLSILGRIAIVKTLALSKLVLFLCTWYSDRFC